MNKALLIEASWEVCNQVGGIYTVIRSKIPAVQSLWESRYCLLGPAVHPDRYAELDELEPDDDLIGKTVVALRKEGIKLFYGTWLVTGRPRVVLFELDEALDSIHQICDQAVENHKITIYRDDQLLMQVLAFNHLMTKFLVTLWEIRKHSRTKIIAQFHEWMAAIPIMDIALKKINIKTIFTTHATMIGRVLAMNDPEFYDNLPSYKWKDEAKHYHIESITEIERKAAKTCTVFTTVSDVTGRECKYLLGKSPDHILPNGLNIKRFVAYHEIQNLHQKYKDEIHQFVLGHFFHSYSFDLDKTLYFYTSGRFEFHNKGFDLTLDALVELNKMMKKAKLDTTVVMFFVTKKPSWSINPEVLQSRGVMEEIRKNCASIRDQVGQRLFLAAANSKGDHKIPDLNTLVDDYWRLRYRRTIQTWKSPNWPIIVTHNLHDPDNDEIIRTLREKALLNSPKDKVKVVYHPDFITSTNPLFGIDYGDFVRGCHLGVFPSYYEPWGYTPLESIASGVPTITSDLSGFGDYIKQNMKIGFDQGVNVLHRDGRKFAAAVHDLAKVLFSFVKETRRYRIVQRNKAEDVAESFDWHKLIDEYQKAYSIALGIK